LGQIVTCNSYRNPALLAKILSTLDVISKGRVELGIGAGWYQNEYYSYGYNFPSNVERIKQLDESISIIKAMWQYERASFQGNYFSINEAICSPHPIQKPRPPIIVGGTGEKYLLKIVAKQADIYNHPFGSPMEIRKKLTALKEHCDDLRKSYNDIELSVLLPCIIKESEEDVLVEINKWKKKNENISAFLERKNGRYTIGTPETILSGLQQYINLGITHFILNFIGLEENTLHFFNSKVINKL
jgi:alkanesulfonate monooxygenase SsuD/methylene tetrahydromethanopterin reductase-like flavin-dependent oxidoreductase (luciferase family)